MKKTEIGSEQHLKQLNMFKILIEKYCLIVNAITNKIFVSPFIANLQRLAIIKYFCFLTGNKEKLIEQ